MKKMYLVFLMVLISGISKADQLAYLTLNQAESATAFLKTQSEIISWCACCDGDSKDYISIDDVYFKNAELDNAYYEVYIKGVRILNKGTNDEVGEVIDKPFDLAYLHFESEGLALNVGKELGFKCKPCTEPFIWGATDSESVVETTVEEFPRPTSAVFIAGRKLLAGVKTVILSGEDDSEGLTTSVSVAKDGEKTMIIFWQETTDQKMNFFNDVWKGTVALYLENGEVIPLVDRNIKGQNKIKNGAKLGYGSKADLYQRFAAYYLTPAECAMLKIHNLSQVAYRTTSSFEQGTTYLAIEENSNSIGEQLLSIGR